MRTHIRPARKHLFHAPRGLRRLSLGITLSLIVLLVGTLGVSLAAPPDAPAGPALGAYIGDYVWRDSNADGLHPLLSL